MPTRAAESRQRPEVYGKHARPDAPDGFRFPSLYGPGAIVKEANEKGIDPDRCREKKVCPEERDRMCKEGKPKSRYFILSPFHNCHGWANGRSK
jgi:hypothetical protein